MTVQSQEKQSFSFSHFPKDSTFNITAKQFKTHDNKSLNYYHFATKDSAKATVLFIHGGGAHGKLGYSYLAQTLKDSFQVETYLLDLRGHGLSDGQRGGTPSSKAVWKDLKSFIKLIKAQSSKPVYLAGHSSGAGLVLNYNNWKKKESVDGYFFVAPEFGYKSDTEKENRVSFAKVKVWKFVLNGMTGGLLFGNSYAVYFNYPQTILEQQPLIVNKITVNMANALTPKKPKKQFTNITQPTGLFVGENDELFDTKKVLAYGRLSNNSKSTSKVITDKTHLSILIDIGNELGVCIEKWLKL